MKKLLAIFLSVVMLLGCVAVSAYANEAADGESTKVPAGETTEESGEDTDTPAAFAIGAGVNFVPVVNENVTTNLSPDAVISDCPYGKAFTGIRTNDTLEFTIDVETAGRYYFSLSYAWGAETSFAVSIDGGEEVTLACPATADWTTIAFSTPTAIELTDGEHTVVLRHSVDGSGVNSFFAVNICDSAEATITYPIWRYAANAMGDRGHSGAWGAATATYAYHANILEAFDGFAFNMPTWGNNTDAYCKIAIYNWAYNYENTLAGEPIATAEFKPMINESWNGIDFEEALPAGEYLFYIYETSLEACGLYHYTADDFVDENGVSYFNGVANPSFAPSLNIKINAGFGEDTEIFGAVSAETEAPTDETTEAPTDETTEAPTDETTEAPAGETTEAPAGETTEAPAGETTEAPAGETTEAPAGETTAAGTDAATAAGTKAPATTTAAAASEGCKAVVGSMSALALVAVASAAVVVLKKKED